MMIKVLCCLLEKWEAKRDTMEEAYNLITIFIEEIIGSLWAYEIDKRIPEDEPNKEKSITLQSF